MLPVYMQSTNADIHLMERFPYIYKDFYMTVREGIDSSKKKLYYFTLYFHLGPQGSLGQSQ